MNEDDAEEMMGRAAREAAKRDYCACCYLPEGSEGYFVGAPSEPDQPPDIPEGLGPLRETAAEALRDWALGNYDAILRWSDSKIICEPYAVA
jgi:hypothetical protein